MTITHNFSLNMKLRYLYLYLVRADKACNRYSETLENSGSTKTQVWIYSPKQM